MADNKRVFDPGFRATDTSGNPLASATIDFFDAGTSDTKTVFSDATLSTSLGSTVTCDSAGAPTSDGSSQVMVYTGTESYKITIKNSGGSTIHTFDNVTGALGTGSFSASTALPKNPVITKTANYTILSGDQAKVVDADPTGGSFTLTLPSAVTEGDDWTVSVKHTGTANTVTVSAAGGQTIDGVTSQVLNYQFESITVVSDGANFHILYDGRRNNLDQSITPQGRLTLTTGVPVLSSDVSAGTNIFYTPYRGNLCPIWTGQRMIPTRFAELTMAGNSNHTLDSHFDLFVFFDPADGTTVTLGTGPAWGTITAGSGARGAATALAFKDGLLTNNISMTARNGSSTFTVPANEGTYVGSVSVDSTAGQFTAHVSYGQARRFSVWNAYNRVPIVMLLGDTTTSVLTASTSGFQIFDSDATNTAAVFTGLAEEWVDILYRQNGTRTADAPLVLTAIGLNSTSAATGFVGRMNSAATVLDVGGIGGHQLPPTLGLNDINILENIAADGIDLLGGNDDCLCVIRYMG